MKSSKSNSSSDSHRHENAESLGYGAKRDISIWLDTYNDLFSDFDPRDFAERNLSDDFLHEIRKVTFEDESHVGHIKLLLPQKVRDEQCEEIIAKRIRLHFKINQQRFEDKRNTAKKKGFLYTILGTIMLLAASYFSYQKYDHFIMHVPLVILEPGGWFLLWLGFENIASTTKKASPELIFHNKVAGTKIIFGSI